MSRIEYQRELNPEQLDVVQHADGPCLVLAGAGSGKTRTITYRVAHLIERGVDPSHILLLTFTNKAAKEMMSRVASLLGADVAPVWGGTFHAIGNRILRTHASAIGVTPRFTILDQEDAESLVKGVMKELSIDSKDRQFPTAAVVHHLVSFATNTMISLEETLERKHSSAAPFVSEISKIAEVYQIKKIQANSMDFDDLLKQWLALLAHPDIGPRIAQRFRYVLVDEYQDTNAIQVAVVSAIAAAHGNLLVVGDDAQSIYAFRGADVKHILTFPQQWQGTKIFKLLTNYRSIPEILDLANDSLSHNERQFQKELVSVRTTGPKPLLAPTPSARQEARFVVDQLLAFRAAGGLLSNMAVLFRSSAHSQALEFELTRRDVPYEYRGGMRFFERTHIKDALAHLRVCDNMKDAVAWMRVLNLHEGIGAATAVAIATRLRSLPDLESALADPCAALGASLPVRSRGGWGTCTSVLTQSAHAQPNPSAMLRAFVTSWYREYLEREYPNWADRIEDLEQLAAFAEAYHDVSSFLSDMTLYDESMSGRNTDAASADGRLVLSTVHQAKGLEWDTVFVMHLAQGSFPSRRSMLEDGGLEEERRLFYVAVTRARHRLVLTYPVTGGFGSMSLNQPSMFLEEVLPQFFERMDMQGAGVERSRIEKEAWSWEEPFIEVEPRHTTSVWKSKINKSAG